MDNNIRLSRGTWMSTRRLTLARQILRQCPNKAIRTAGLACLRNAKPEYLWNIIPMNTPAETAAMFYIEKSTTEGPHQ